MVNEKDLQSYLKIAAPALPCRAARKEFSSYVHNVARVNVKSKCENFII